MIDGLTLAFTSLIPGSWEWLIILAVGLLFFGRRLPEVGRNIGKTVVEFRKGIKDIENEVEEESRREGTRELPADSQAVRSTIEPEERAVSQQGGTQAGAGPKPSEA